MADKVQSSREAIAEIEDRARRIKGEIDFLLESDHRMRTDESYRNQVIGDRLRDVQNLQEQAQAHQRIIIQYQSSTVETTGRVTRSRAASQTSISTVAANIQQAARSTRSATVSQQTQSRSRIEKHAISEEQQKRSVQALYGARKWLTDREQQLVSILETAGLRDRIDDSTYREYAAVSSLRKWTDTLCTRLSANPGDPHATASLKQIIAYVGSLAS